MNKQQRLTKALEEIISKIKSSGCVYANGKASQPHYSLQEKVLTIAKEALEEPVVASLTNMNTGEKKEWVESELSDCDNCDAGKDTEEDAPPENEDDDTCYNASCPMSYKYHSKTEYNCDYDGPCDACRNNQHCPEKEEPVQWEYQVVPADDVTLNEWGEKGWELVLFADSKLIFKRKKN